MTVLLLVWLCADRLDCTYGQVGIVKHDAGTLGVLWVIHGAPSTLRIAGDDRRHDGETKMGREPPIAAHFHRACSRRWSRGR